MIPKLIHQCWVNATPDVQRQNNVNSMRNLNKDYAHTLWDEDNIPRFILKHFGTHILGVYNSINPKYGAARADLFRYLVCYELGGVYLDIKSLYTRPLNTFLNPQDEYILTGDTREWHQWHIMCSPGHAILASTLAKVLNNIEHYSIINDGVGKQAVLKVTGPQPYTAAVNANRRYCFGVRHCTPFPYRLLYDTIGWDERTSDPTHYSNQTEPLICR